jgi:hypothetical protein
LAALKRIEIALFHHLTIYLQIRPSSSARDGPSCFQHWLLAADLLQRQLVAFVAAGKAELKSSRRCPFDRLAGKMDAHGASWLNVTFKAPFYVASRNAQPSPMAHLTAPGEQVRLLDQNHMLINATNPPTT